jgi:hypothetical protein
VGAERVAAFENAVTIGALLLTVVAAALLASAVVRSARGRVPSPSATE